ncbi:ABC transporter A family member 1-like [Heracleum sosnowskyi]|uniref:ABC transporter A family member 1-like n=1 Tax=Heracleum sosnowskyi TaxID=360622 RepID=A0AAD8MEU7_9APIA|nr:ABC transporter A family member 1-like [Heracleum sosnowskyi]
MDPIAKRFMWEVISRLSTRQGKTAVILTTHSMKEAQALCTRIGIMVGDRLRCIGSSQHLKTRFGNHLELEIKPTEVISTELEYMCQIIQERLFDLPSQRRGILGELEICIGGSDSLPSENASVAEIRLSAAMMVAIGHWLGNEERIQTLLSPSCGSDEISDEQLSEQLARDGFEAYVLDFHIRKNVNSSPNDRKKRLLKSEISLTEERRKRNIPLLVEEVMVELEFVTEEDAP